MGWDESSFLESEDGDLEPLLGYGQHRLLRELLPIALPGAIILRRRTENRRLQSPTPPQPPFH